jgi:hypothetical protein
VAWSKLTMVHETKFLIPLEKAPLVLAFAREHLEPDPHGHGPHRDEYLVQSIYFDTPEFHVFRKHGSYGRAKYRVRRYGNADWLFLERKLKRQGLVRKRRTEIGLEELPAITKLPEAAWYRRRLDLRKLNPLMYIQYARAARMKLTAEGMLRLTVDQALRFDTEVNGEWPRTEGAPFLTEFAVLELKYLTLPSIAKKMIEEFNLSPGAASKYRMAIRASKLAPQALAFDGGESGDHSDLENSSLKIA